MTPKQQANVDKWVAALRSGKYEQGRNVLRRNDEFCCLGVLYDVLGIQGHKETAGIYNYGGYKTSLSIELRSAVGLRTAEGDFTDNDGMDCLTSMNDRGLSFDVIAEKIESKPEGLFV